MLTITTTYRTDARGKGKVTAKGHGRQRTIPYDHAASAERNHGAAAGVLLRTAIVPDRLGGVFTAAQHQRECESIAQRTMVHMGFNDGTHKFNIEA